MCIFWTLIIWELHFKVQTSFEAQNFVLLLSLSLHSSSLTFKLLSMAYYGGELLLESSPPWSGVSNHLSSFSIALAFIFKKQRTPLMKKIQGLQVPHGATSSCVVKSSTSCSFRHTKDWHVHFWEDIDLRIFLWLCWCTFGIWLSKN